MIRAHYDVIVLGAGLGGIGIGSRLKAAGIERFVILEKAQSLGGTWRENIYPGAACDTESHLYCYEFALHLGVSRVYARQPELLRYAEQIAASAGLAPHIRYGSEVTAAKWSDESCRWHIALANGQALSCRAFIPAWGQLNRPSIPDFPGRADFAGRAFHSARWPRDLDLTGCRVASVGNAASAIQYIPEIAPGVECLTVFQRSPNWIVPRGDREYSPQELREFADAATFRSDRRRLFEWRETTFMRMLAGSDDARELESTALAHLAAQVPDGDLRAKLTPDFALGCKRILRSDDYFPALMRDNVALETDAIARILPTGIETVNGVRHQLDVIIFGTGFETRSFQGPVDVFGRQGMSLRDVWAPGAHAYLGMVVSGFPNFFLIYGPNTNLGHNSILSMLEAQFAYIVAALRFILAEPDRAIDVHSQVMHEFDDKLQKSMIGTAWTGGCTSWYKGPNGRVINNWSGPVIEYQRATSQFLERDYADRRAAVVP